MLSRAGPLPLPALREPIGDGLRAAPSENRVGSLPANFSKLAVEYRVRDTWRSSLSSSRPQTKMADRKRRALQAVDGQSLVGERVSKFFKGYGTFSGEIEPVWIVVPSCSPALPSCKACAQWLEFEARRQTITCDSSCALMHRKSRCLPQGHAQAVKR
jgi:hypothetical protein